MSVEPLLVDSGSVREGSRAAEQGAGHGLVPLPPITVSTQGCAVNPSLHIKAGNSRRRVRVNEGTVKEVLENLWINEPLKNGRHYVSERYYLNLGRKEILFLICDV